MKLRNQIAALDWHSVYASLNTKGYAVIPDFLNETWCRKICALFPQDALFRKTVVMHRYRFGLGEYRYFAAPLPPTIQGLRSLLYPFLAPLANEWAEKLKLGITYPPALEDFSAQCRAAGQTLPTALILQYGKGGHNTLHQDLYGDVYFPIQALFVLSRHGADFDGGEFVLTEQIPRAQSRPVVLKPNRGDMVLFATRFRPEQGKSGFYRVNIKHGVAEITRGSRTAMGIIFHDAVS